MGNKGVLTCKIDGPVKTGRTGLADTFWRHPITRTSQYPSFLRYTDVQPFLSAKSTCYCMHNNYAPPEIGLKLGNQVDITLYRSIHTDEDLK